MSKSMKYARRIAIVVGVVLAVFGGAPWHDLAFVALVANSLWCSWWCQTQLGYALNDDPRGDPKVASLVEQYDYVPANVTIYGIWVLFFVFTLPTLIALRYGPWWLSLTSLVLILVGTFKHMLRPEPQVEDQKLFLD